MVALVAILLSAHLQSLSCCSTFFLLVVHPTVSACHQVATSPTCTEDFEYAAAPPACLRQNVHQIDFPSDAPTP